MAKLAKLLYKYDPIRDPKDFSDKESWCPSDGESYYSLDKENPVKFKNEILLGVLKKVP